MLNPGFSFGSEYVFNTEVRRGPIIIVLCRSEKLTEMMCDVYYRPTLFPYLRRRFEQALRDRFRIASYNYIRLVFLSTSPSNLMMLPYCIILPFVH